MKKFILFYFATIAINSYAMLKLPYGIESDMVEIVIKNNFPCFYLKDDKRRIRYISAEQYKKPYIWNLFVDNIKGNGINNCIPFGDGKIKFNYNEPYRIFVEDNLSKSFTHDSYRLDICIINQDGKYNVVQVNYINKAKGMMTCKDPLNK